MTAQPTPCTRYNRMLARAEEAGLKVTLRETTSADLGIEAYEAEVVDPLDPHTYPEVLWVHARRYVGGSTKAKAFRISAHQGSDLITPTRIWFRLQEMRLNHQDRASRQPRQY